MISQTRDGKIGRYTIELNSARIRKGITVELAEARGKSFR